MDTKKKVKTLKGWGLVDSVSLKLMLNNRDGQFLWDVRQTRENALHSTRGRSGLKIVPCTITFKV